MESCSNQKSCWTKIYFIFEILQRSHPLPWWQLCTLLAFSQLASWGSHRECISINRCALLRVNYFFWILSLLCLSQSIVLWQGRGGIQKIARKGQISKEKRQSITLRPEGQSIRKMSRTFKCSRKKHHALWWNWLSCGTPQERKTSAPEDTFIRVNCTLDCSPNKCFKKCK